jgi:hypothetical protein
MQVSSASLLEPVQTTNELVTIEEMKLSLINDYGVQDNFDNKSNEFINELYRHNTIMKSNTQVINPATGRCFTYKKTIEKNFYKNVIR